MLKRPSVHDDDDEILRQQEEFYKQKSQQKFIPAATLLGNDSENPSASTKSDELMDVDDEKNITQTAIQDQIANTFEAVPTDGKLKNITENKPDSRGIKVLKFDTGGFPKAVRRDPDIKPKKGSIFSQHIKRLKTDKSEIQPEASQSLNENSIAVKEKIVVDHIFKETISKNVSHNLETLATASKRSTILTPSDRKQIHNENMDKLESMSEEEILAEKQRLLSTLDPALIQFLKSQRSEHKEELENRNKTIKEQNDAAGEVDIEQLEIPKKILSKPESAGWLHFNEFEANKLAWMKDINTADLRKVKGFEARFDLEGYLLPYSVSQIDDSNRHLYHHGDEPERPGYSLQELLLLSRSNITQQRCVALNTLANILGLEQTGIYEQVIEIPVEQIFFVLRVCMDDNTPSVLTAAVKALRNLIYFQIDETCLDNMGSFGLGLVQPILAVDHNSEDDNTVNDQQLAEINLPKCLVRTNILSRIRYVLNTVKPSLETVIYCVEILVRLARDSEFIVNKILQTEGLLSGIFVNFLTQTSHIGLSQSTPGYNLPLPQVIKLLRILSARNRTTAEHLLRKHDILSTTLSYLYEDYFSQNALGLKLQVECFNYWTILIHYGLALDSVREHRGLLYTFLDYHFKHTDNIVSTKLIRQSHLAAVIMFLSKAVEKEFNFFTELSSQCFLKWMKQFKIFDAFKCGHSQITSALLHYAASYNRNFVPLYTEDILLNLLESTGFHVATKHIINGSLLLNNYQTHKTSANLRSLEAATWFSMDHIVPVMQTNSCIPLLYSLSACILSDKSYKLMVKFLNNPRIKEYTGKLKDAKCYFNVGNWFTRCESFLVMNILKIAQIVQDHIDPTEYYDIAVKCLCVFSAEQKLDIKFLLENVVFCPRFYSVEVALANIGVSETMSQLGEAWRHLDDIKLVYSDILGLTKNIITFDATLSLDMSIGNVIPVDWIYTPLVLLYSNQQKTEDNLNDESKDFIITLNCLRWILIYETYFPGLAESISATEKYTRLGCLFLGSDSFFLDPDVQQLLVLIYQFLVKRESTMNFEQEISGLTNFKDFFVQLLEQYQGVSYGNKVFGNVLLFPLMKRHDVKYRKTLWSEYMGVVETFTVPREEVWLNSNDLIYPVDTDYSLFACYSKALAMKKVPENSVMFEIASTNVRQYKTAMQTSNSN